MKQEVQFPHIKHIVEVSTNIGRHCEHCTKMMGLDNFTESVNHYIDEHGYKLLHVGTETGRNSDDGSPWHSTAAILGK